MAREVVFQYEIDYQGAYKSAEEIAQEIIRDHPELAYRIVTKPGEGVYVKLYGQNEELILEISEGMSERETELLLAGTPVYVTYGGRRIGLSDE
ncbi:hypothetical protein LR021_02070 [Candidatus Bipolaricaulota bacterium]|nr:hypothetical protein [Candidatus Bipolaricaulota bacterium]